MNNVGWILAPSSLRRVEWAIIVPHFCKGELFLWLWALLNEEEAERLECKITVGDPNGISLTYPAPVYSLTWDRERIMADDRCLRFSYWSVTKMLTNEGITDVNRSNGISSMFIVNYHVSKKS
jgi:hypothetical protein